jgi:predicted nuclease of predicted toxin-antitoxin system
VKLLFDENVSPKLVGMVAREFPGCAHVTDIGLRGAEDQKIWDYAREQGLMIVSKDTDFRERSYVEGFPPKIIWLDVGNAGTASIVELLRRERQRIEHFDHQEENSLLILSIGQPTAI